MMLVVLTPPDHVERVCYQAQDRLWQLHGLVSSRALPPLIALGRLETPPVDTLLTVLDGIELEPFRLDTVQPVGDTYAAPLQPATAGHLLRGRILGDADTRLPGMLPLEALFLGCLERPGLPDHPLGTEPLWPLPIRTATVAVIEIAAAEGDFWWQTVAWRIIGEHKLTAASR